MLKSHQNSLITEQQATEACTQSQQPYQTMGFSFGDSWMSDRTVVMFIDDQRLLRLVACSITHVFEFEVFCDRNGRGLMVLDSRLLSINKDGLSKVRSRQRPRPGFADGGL